MAIALLILLTIPFGTAGSLLIACARVPTAPGACQACKYSLTGLPEVTTRCPECGGEFAGKARARRRIRAWMAALGIGLILASLGSCLASGWLMMLAGADC